MSRFGFNFGRDNKKNIRRDRDDVVLRHEASSEYDAYEEQEYEDNTSYDSRDPRDPRLMMRPYRAEDARSQRGSRQRSDQDEYEDAPVGFRRTNTASDDFLRGYSQRDDVHQSQNHSGQRATNGFDQRQNQQYSRQAQRDDVKGLGFWQNDDSDANYDDSEVDADRPSPLKFIIAITGLVFICTVTWLAYRWISLPTSDTPPLIQAEADPYRMRPENPGGTDFPHQDKLIYGRLAPSTDQPVERLLPPPEQPIIMAPTYDTQFQQQGVQQPQQPNQPQGQYPQQQGYYPSSAQPQQAQPQQQEQVPAQPAPQVYAAYPQQNQPVPQAQAAQGVQQPQAQPQPYPNQVYPQQQYPVQPQAMQQGPVPQSAPNLNALPQNQPQQYQQQMAQNPATLMEPKLDVKPNAATTLDAVVNTIQEEKVVPADTTHYYLQLGTLLSESLAKKEKERLQKRYAAELTGMDLSVKSFVASDGHKKYRIVAGPTIQSRKAALDKCAKLGNACSPVKSYCWRTRNACSPVKS
ncbi:MAG: SPOR domain-containing protein [Pseudomonadota bacterium]